MDKQKAKEYLDYLDEKYTEWYTHLKLRSKIAAEIREMSKSWDDEIYLHLSDGNANGLFEPGFFESDVKKAFRILKGIVEDEKAKPVNKMYRIYSALQNYKVPQNEVAKKELRDYLLEKIHGGNLADGKITFKDNEDYVYFSKLTAGLGLNADVLLEEIVFNTFVTEV